MQQKQAKALWKDLSNDIQYIFVGYTVPKKLVKNPKLLIFIISRRALAREGDYEMMPVCACMRECVRVCVR